jgi:acetyl-CoA C-acetyltransferase
MGQVLQAGVGQNPARQAAIHAGLPQTIAALTVNKVCGSGLKAVMLGAQAIRAGDADIVLAGGMENMSQAPFLLSGVRAGWKFGSHSAVDSMVHDGLHCALEKRGMGELAEYTAEHWHVTRADMDCFSAQSQQRAADASTKGRFAAEVLPVSVAQGKKSLIVAKDEGIREETTLESLGKLRPAFREQGTVTAGNSSTLSDGAAALALASQTAIRKHGLQPRARIIAYATAGVAPRDLFIAPVQAIRQALNKASLRLDELDLFEINEAFAAQMLACLSELKMDSSRVNVHGGAIALGHPIGASGARVLVTLLHALEHHGKQRGLAALCLGGGNAVAMVVERIP